jgi:cellulose synthase/poly-beta-1,6-N-acetylglucosamine synthase-like glycosyltransferase
MTSRFDVAVVVPARDEQARITAAVASVTGALDRAREAGLVRSSIVVVVADACRDATAALAEAALGDAGTVIDVTARCAGAARAAGSAVALAELGADRSRVWLANTDADSTVPLGWIVRQLDAAARGTELLAGVVDLDGDDPEVRRAFARSEYRRAIGRDHHPHVHGANLGIRADVLDRVGGWRALRTGEDQDLWARAAAAGVVRCADPGLVVTTSGRRTGRAPAGFARDLRRLVAASATGDPRLAWSTAGPA